jgi:hypothetical protein
MSIKATKKDFLRSIKLMRVLLIILFVQTTLFAQRQNNLSKSELGVFCGGSYYIGDLNPLSHFKNTASATGIIGKFNINPRWALRGLLVYGSVSANDAQSESKYDGVYTNRNLSFSSTILEVGGGFEFNYFPFQIGNSTYRGSGYLFAEIAYFQMNPTTNYNGQTVELRTIGTEGQGTPLNNSNYYSKNQLSIPLGIGFKYPFGNYFCLGMEYGVRKTFTDYLDDVGSDRFIDKSQLNEYASPLTVALSNRNLNGSSFGPRGDSKTKDWYFMFGLTLTIRLGNPDECFKH